MAGLSRLRAAAALQLRQIARSRAYGSAAAAQLQYDYDYDECDLHGQASEPMLRLDSAGLPPRRGVQWVLIGDPGVKKHVYAENLSKLLEVPHISMGSLVRQELSPRSALYKQVYFLLYYYLQNKVKGLRFMFYLRQFVINYFREILFIIIFS